MLLTPTERFIGHEKNGELVIFDCLVHAIIVEESHYAEESEYGYGMARMLDPPYKGNLGDVGIAQFKAAHICNDVCTQLNLLPMV